MPQEGTFDDLIAKLSFTPVDSKDFLNLLFQTDQNGVDYLSNLKKDFKEKYVLPVYQKAIKNYETLGKKIDDSTKKESLDAIADPLNIVTLNKEYKEKTKKIFEDKLKEISDTINIDAPSANLKDTLISSVIPEPTQNIQEQQTFTKKEPIVSLSDESLEKLKNLLNVNVNVKSQQTVATEEKSDLLSTLGKLLLAGGVAGLLVSAFWDKIKPWLEDKFDFNLDFLDKFEGTLEGISKFFTLGGLKVTAGPLFNLVGKAFTTVGELIEGGLSAIFKLGFGDEIVEQGAKAAPAAWRALLPKIAGGLFKGVGLVGLKAIPIIGSLISLYFAYDRFNKGDIIGGLIDVAGGITNLIPGVGIPLSLGLAALNAFLDYQAGEGTIDQKQNAKLDFFGKIAEFIREIPFVGWIMNFTQGLYELVSGNFETGLDFLMKQPFLGPFPAIVKSMMDATTTDEQGNTRFSFDTFSKKLKSNMGKWLLNQVPNWFGARKMLADFIGIPFNESTGEVMDFEESSGIGDERTPTNLRLQKAQQTLDPSVVQYSENKEKELAEKELEYRRMYDQSKQEYEKSQEYALDGWNPFHDSEKEASLKKDLDNTQMELQIAQQELLQYRKLNPKMREDFSFSSLLNNNGNMERSVLIDNKNNTANILDPNDNILAYKTDGVFDKSLKNMTTIMDSMNKGIYKMFSSFENYQNKPSSINISNQQGGGSSYKDFAFSGTRDSIYDLRNNWWKSTSNLRSFA
jgi:hypothetical protein